MPHCAAVRTCLQLLTHISGSVSLSLFPLPHPSSSVSRWARSQLGKHLTTGAHMNAQHSGSKRMPQWDTNAHTHTRTQTHTQECQSVFDMLQINGVNIEWSALSRHEGNWDCRDANWDHAATLAEIYEYIFYTNVYTNILIVISHVLFSWLHKQAIYLSLVWGTKRSFAA